jgi:hypothetical protein
MTIPWTDSVWRAVPFALIIEKYRVGRRLKARGSPSPPPDRDLGAKNLSSRIGDRRFMRSV